MQTAGLALIRGSVHWGECPIPVPQICKRGLLLYMAMAAALFQRLGVTHDCCGSDGECALH